MVQVKKEYKILPNLVLIGIGIFVITAVSAWTVPTVAPPGGNVSSPINIGATAQTKTGGFGTLGGIVAGLDINAGGKMMAGGDIKAGGFFYEAGARMQRLVGGSCGVGSSIRAIDANGNVTCEIDDVGGGGLHSCYFKEATGGAVIDLQCNGGADHRITGVGCISNNGAGVVRFIWMSTVWWSGDDSYGSCWGTAPMQIKISCCKK